MRLKYNRQECGLDSGRMSLTRSGRLKDHSVDLAMQQNHPSLISHKTLPVRLHRSNRYSQGHTHTHTWPKTVVSLPSNHPSHEHTHSRGGRFHLLPHHQASISFVNSEGTGWSDEVSKQKKKKPTHTYINDKLNSRNVKTKQNNNKQTKTFKIVQHNTERQK